MIKIIAIIIISIVLIERAYQERKRRELERCLYKANRKAERLQETVCILRIKKRELPKSKLTKEQLIELEKEEENVS